MKTHDTRAFANQLLICLLVTIGFGGSVGLGTVWMRHRISALANANRKLLSDIADVQREISVAEAETALEKDPDQLRRRNAQWHLGLVPVNDPQVHVFAVNESPQRLLLERNNRDLYREDASPAIKLPLAALNR
jgi:hypothetical protein